MNFGCTLIFSFFLMEIQEIDSNVILNKGIPLHGGRKTNYKNINSKDIKNGNNDFYRFHFDGMHHNGKV